MSKEIRIENFCGRKTYSLLDSDYLSCVELVGADSLLADEVMTLVVNATVTGSDSSTALI